MTTLGSTANRLVLLVEDDAGIAELERRVLARAGLTAQVTHSVQDALKKLKSETFIAILLDYKLPDGDPWTIVEAAEAMNPRVPVILVTAMGNERVAAEAIHRGVAEYLRKTDSFLDQLPNSIERVARLAHAEESLKRTDALFQLIASNTEDVILLSNIDGVIKYISPACRELYGYEPEELIGTSSLDLIHPQDRARVGELIAATQPQQRLTTIFRGLRRDAQDVWVESNITGLPDRITGKVKEVVRVSRNITERKRAEAAVRDQEARYRSLFEDSPISLWEEDFSEVRSYLDELKASGIADLPMYLRTHREAVRMAASRVKILAINDATSRLYEAASADILLDGLHKTFTEQSLDVFCEELCALLDGATRFVSEARTKTLAGRDNIISIQVSLLPESKNSWKRVVVSMFDVTAHRDTERRLRESVLEKDVLLKEIHHRVKNNLQVVSSLLNMQIRRVTHDATREVLNECRSRISSIAMIHENLYQSHDLSHVNFDNYARTLINHLFYSLGAIDRNILPVIDFENIRLSVDSAIPCGLIINELVTNSIKHAFANRTSGTIYIGAHHRASDIIELTIEDDGVGLPAQFDARKLGTLGLDLVYTFAKQLDADIEVVRSKGKGAGFLLRFKSAS